MPWGAFLNLLDFWMDFKWANYRLFVTIVVFFLAHGLCGHEHFSIRVGTRIHLGTLTRLHYSRPKLSTTVVTHSTIQILTVSVEVTGFGLCHSTERTTSRWVLFGVVYFGLWQHSPSYQGCPVSREACARTDRRINLLFLLRASYEFV